VAAELLGAPEGLSIRKGAVWWFESRGGGEVLLRAVMDAETAEGS